MAEQTITITIDENGKIKAETAGIKGEMCLDELQELLDNQNDLLAIKKTDEYFQQEKTQIKNKIQNKN
ncbi:DUF2997 domain-containing protein [Tenacibaculum finnmarkense]|uniref:DUF2997 domain-containing protein n=1 Tax=Tenacibaculum finnmarkense TaxID=2781243 RepID=UPI00187B6C78|nr:DUF2997 domain-containing protein [Tenacibaculum finnmarkense]MBE7634096.1 DUF2997 domain-containing protein [Tenacibaculum finnmarkense genomovar ulcerans]MBE7645404.1 DUF2997 domain-containing protein [Tenacibaculum finnmarkense genomovar ulcerans]MBE7649054.1 DUF2997 domain-containing protein [Tenacibaculum finnmarkense genomovar ulcerans]MCD8409660.1 DUF2997 domain-containing protein [Tenacibaculum finnmarkense genomovar ulcerans]MCD8429852.1 DUF2997 domain-containing protein [Tenacibac